MKPDLSLINLNHGLCEAIERSGIICFQKKYCKGYCCTHYTRLLRTGSINPTIKQNKKCKFIDCKEDFFAKGYCVNHYRKFIRSNTSNICTVDECNKRTTGKYCSMHRTRVKRYGTTLGSGYKKGSTFKPGNTFIRQKEYKICLAKACNRDSNEFKITKGLCPKHYRRWLLSGEYEDVGVC